MKRQIRQNGTGLAVGIAVAMVVGVAVWVGYVVNHNSNERQRQEQADQKEQQTIAEFKKAIAESERNLSQLREQVERGKLRALASDPSLPKYDREVYGIAAEGGMTVAEAKKKLAEDHRKQEEFFRKAQADIDLQMKERGTPSNANSRNAGESER